MIILNFQSGNWVINNEDLEIINYSPFRVNKLIKNKCLLKVNYANEMYFFANFKDYSRQFECKQFRLASELEINLYKVKKTFIK
jgi:hypothetical protein